MDGELWDRCKAGDAQARGALIERHAGLAAQAARRMRLPVGTLVGHDDLESAGFLGLIDAVDRFDPERGVPFEAYALLRIRGAIIDELRRVDARGRRKASAVPSDGALSGYLTGTLSLDLLLEVGDAATAVARDEMSERHDAEDLRMRVDYAVRDLPPRQREVLARYYGEELTLREAGARMGISEARACQLHGRAIANLRSQLAAARRAFAPAMAGAAA